MLISLGAIVGIVIGGIILLLIILGVSWYIHTLNWFNTIKVKIDESKSSINISLNKRFDLLTKELAVVKGYSKYESETLENIVNLRKKDFSSLSSKEIDEIDSKLNDFNKELNVVVENYPNLKADSQYLNLQNEISACENDLQAARKIFNMNVSLYNQKVVTFPDKIVAKMNKFGKIEFYEVEESKKEDVEIKF